MIRYCFDEEHELFRDAFRTFLEREVRPHMDRWREQGHVDRAVWEKAGQNNFLIPRAPEHLGGLGIDDFRYEQIMIEEQGYIGDTGFVLYNLNTLVAPYFLDHASDDLQQRYLPRAAAGEFIFGLAMTEAGAGSDLAGMKSRAVRDGDHYVLNGSKTFISNGIIADGFVIAARTGDGRHDVSLFVVEAAWDGFEKGRNLKKMGMASQDTAELFFDDVAVPCENLIGEEGQGFRYLMHGLAEERVSCAIQSLANAEYAFDLTLDYVKEREAFGRTIGSFQNTQFTLADLRARLDSAQAFVDALVHAINLGDDVEVEAAGAKLLTSELQGDVVDECLQFFGGHGYMDEFPISRLYTDARISRIFGGTSEIMKMIIARSLELR